MGIGLVLLLAQERTRTNVARRLGRCRIRLRRRHPVPLRRRGQSAPIRGWLPRLQGLLEVAGIAMSGDVHEWPARDGGGVPSGRGRRAMGGPLRPTALPAGTLVAVLAFPARAPRRLRPVRGSTSQRERPRGSGCSPGSGSPCAVAFVVRVRRASDATGSITRSATGRPHAAISSGFDRGIVVHAGRGRAGALPGRRGRHHVGSAAVTAAAGARRSCLPQPLPVASGRPSWCRRGGSSRSPRPHQAELTVRRGRPAQASRRTPRACRRRRWSTC